MMGVDAGILIGVALLTLLGLLLTGPGTWSETWGWRFLERRRREPPDRPT